jgi:ring-1,2-phenylacetyl-CoA epoxidase subunit PaaC
VVSAPAAVARRDVVADPVFEYLLRLGDSPLILAQRLGEWVGHGPVLEEDIAQTNVGLDLLGQARLWLSYAGEVEARFAPPGRSEDELAFLRDSGDFRNLLLAEQPNGNFADTTARQFLFDAWHLPLLRALARSRDARIAEIAAKAAKEAAYHVERSSAWVIRLGDGTDESHAKMQASIDDLWMYTGEMFTADALELALIEAGIAADVRALEGTWRAHVEEILREATLTTPGPSFMQQGGKRGVHTEHLGHLLSEMQALARSHPGARW